MEIIPDLKKDHVLVDLFNQEDQLREEERKRQKRMNKKQAPIDELWEEKMRFLSEVVPKIPAEIDEAYNQQKVS